jgi:surface polysaccharide O-acyltransferase-like enzyme
MFKTRIDEIEILRGLTFLAIVMQHTLASFIYSPDITKGSALTAALLLTLVRYAVPMFIFITGMVLVYNYGEGDFSYSTFIKKRFTQIFLPYFIWTSIYFVWVSFTNGIPASDLDVIMRKIAKLTLSGEGYFHLWFMVVVLQIYLLFPLFRSLLSRNHVKNMVTLSICFILNFGLLYLFQHKSPQIMASLHSSLLITLYEYRDRIFISWIFYFMFGAFAGFYIDQLRYILKTSLKTNIFVYFCSLGLVLYYLLKTSHTDTTANYILNNQFNGPLNYMMMVFITSSLLMVYYLAQTVLNQHKTTRQILTSFGRYSYGCYFIHAFMLFYVYALVHKYLTELGTIGQVIVIFGVCSALSLFACFALSRIRIPLGNLLTGRNAYNSSVPQFQAEIDERISFDHNNSRSI